MSITQIALKRRYLKWYRTLNEYTHTQVRNPVRPDIYTPQQVEYAKRALEMATSKYIQALKQFFKENPEKKVYYIDNHYTGKICQYAQLKYDASTATYFIEDKCNCDWD